MFFLLFFSNMFNIICQQPSNLSMSTPGVFKDFPRDSLAWRLLGTISSQGFIWVLLSTFHIYHSSTLKKKAILIPNVAVEDCPRELKKKKKKQLHGDQKTVENISVWEVFFIRVPSVSPLHLFHGRGVKKL